MADLGRFPDPEACLLDLLTDLVSDEDDVRTKVPADLQQRIAAGRHVIRVNRLGGADDRFTDRARVAIQVLAGTLADAKDVSELIRQRLLSRPHATAAGVIDRSRTETGPTEWPYEDQDIRSVRGIYRMSLRRRRTA